MFTQRSNNERFIMQIGVIFRQLEGMIMQMQITCAIRLEQMMKGMGKIISGQFNSRAEIKPFHANVDEG